MKTLTLIKRSTAVALLAAALAVPVWAQGGPGMGGGMGGGMGSGMGSGPGTQNAGPGMGRGGRAMMFDQKNVRGWTLMTPEERTAFQIRMREVKTYDECKSVQGEHRTVIESRAKEKGVSLMAPRANACDTLKSRGLIK